jgi:hypothetical protein
MLVDAFPDETFLLRVEDDHEQAANPVLLVMIRTMREVSDAMSRLDQADTDWWIEASQTFAGRLQLMLDYV